MWFTLWAFSYPAFIIILPAAASAVQNLAFKTTKKPFPFAVKRVGQRHVVSRLECSTECSRHAVCVAFEYKREASCTIYIYRKASGSGSGNLQPDPDTTYGILNVVHRYMGCYRDWSNQVLPQTFMLDRKSMTTLTCKLYCYGLSYSYFGITTGFMCCCGDVIKEGHPKVADKNCKSRCVGDKSEMCGGKYEMSIFKMD